MSSKLLILISFAIFSEIGYSLLAPLYPFLAKSRDLSDSLIGIIFSSFAISNFLATMFTPLLIKRVGRQELLYFGLILEGVCSICFGFISFVSDYTLFTLCSFVIRFLQGFGGAVVQTLIYSLTAAISSKDTIERNFGYIELGCSLGVAVGPLFASVGYYFCGFEFPFVLAGVCEFILLKFIKHLSIEESEDEDSQTNVISLLTNKNIFMTFLAVIIDMISISFIYPIFATHIHKKFKLDPEIISLFFIVETITYFFALQILNTVNKKLGNKLTMVLGTVLNGTFILMLTPIRYLPQNSFTVIVGLAGLGIAGALVSIPAVIDIIETMKNELHIEEHTAQDYSSAIFNLGYFIGETIGPLLGGTLTDKYGFENACNINSAFNYMFGFSFGMVVYQQLALIKVIKSKRKLSKCIDVNSNCSEYMKLNDDRHVEFDV